MDVQLFQHWFFRELVQCVQKFLRKCSLPERAFLLVDYALSYSATISLQCKGTVVKFLPPTTMSIVLYNQ